MKTWASNEKTVFVVIESRGKELETKTAGLGSEVPWEKRERIQSRIQSSHLGDLADIDASNHNFGMQEIKQIEGKIMA